MNLLNESTRKLEYNKKLLEELKTFFDTTNTSNLSYECLKGIKSDIKRFENNIEYYTAIIKILEENN